MKKGRTTLSKSQQTGTKIILTALKVEEALAELLKGETKKMKMTLGNEDCIEELKKINTLLKNTIIAMMMTEEKIRMGISFYEKDTEE